MERERREEEQRKDKKKEDKRKQTQKEQGLDPADSQEATEDSVRVLIATFGLEPFKH